MKKVLVIIISWSGCPINGVAFGLLVGEDEGGARTVGAAHHGDGVARQLQLRIEFGDRGIVPLLDLAEIDIGQDFTRELELIVGAAAYELLTAGVPTDAEHMRGVAGQRAQFFSRRGGENC